MQFSGRIWVKAAVVALAGIVTVALAGALWLRDQLATPVPFPPDGIAVHIDAGWSLRRIAARLEHAGVVRSRWVLIGMARWRGVAHALRAGDYQFTGAARPAEILGLLVSSTGALQMITIPEGQSTAEVMALLAAAGFGAADAFACAAASPEWLRDLDLPPTGVEGYLFPDTYAFSRRAAPADILRSMVERYRARSRHLVEDRARSGLSEHEMVTLASLIEKETGAPEERALISAVFHNRLRIGMPLQSDPTAVYERPEFRGPISRSDLQVPSLYNTYQHPGLPPGPIANPGLAALEAAVHPASAGYLYFMSRHDGTHQFSTTLEDHNRAVARYGRAANGT